jgi:predicted ATPase
VGKSRLAVELVRRWRDHGGASHSGDCVSYGQKTPYLPWRGILSSIAGLSPRLPVPERLARLERLLRRLPLPAGVADANESYWLERLPLLAELLGLESKESNLTRGLSDDLRRDNIFTAIRTIVLEETRQDPALILLEDTHWSDELSLELAAHLASEATGYPLWLVLAHRPLGNPAPPVYQRLLAMSHTTLLPVEELEAEAGIKLAQAKLGVKQLPEAVADLICRKGQGNPLFIEELVNSLLSLETIKVEGSECYITGDLDKLELPDTVQKVVLARIDRLPEAEKITLKVAAAIGRTFQLDLLEAVHPWVMASTSLNDQLARLQAEDFTRQEVRESNLDFLFKHVITQEVAYETMLYSQRRELHATIGAALEARAVQNQGEFIDLLAYHYFRSHRRDKALEYLNRAGQKALDGYANEAAISYFNDALAVAAELELVNVQFELLAGREKAFGCLGNRLAQVQDLTQMAELALAQGNVGQQLDTGSRRLQLAANMGDYHEALALAEQALALAQQHQQLLWAARTLVNVGMIHWRQGDYDQARTALQQALEINGSANDDQLMATALNYLGLIHTRLAEYEQARQDYRRALELYRASHDRGGEAGCANNLGLLEASLGRYEQAQRYYNQALSICHTIGDRQREGISLNTLGQVLTLLGNYDQAQEKLEQSLNIRNAIGDRRGAAFCLHDIGALYVARHQADEAIHYFHTACELRRELGEIGNYVASLAAKGEASLAAGDKVLAYQCLREALDHLQNGAGSGEYPPQNVWWAYAQICQARGHEAEANAALQQAYSLVKAKADQIRQPELQRSYLEHVKINAAIVAAITRINCEL